MWIEASPSSSPESISNSGCIIVRLCEYESHLDLPEQRHLLSRREHIGEITAVEPFARQNALGSVRERRFEQAQIAPLESGYFGRTHLREHRRHLAGREFANRFDVAAVLVTEGRVEEKILNALEALGLQHRCARGANAFQIHEWGREVQRFS